MYNWKKTILHQSETMERAIEVLNKEALRIVMVVNKDNSLVGTITDGDIRRSLISGLTLSSKLKEFMFTSPTVVKNNCDRSEILEIMNELDLLQIPVVDNNKCVVGLETMQGMHNKKKLDNVVVLMAGGFGKRLSPLTDKTPKPLLKVGDQPILEDILKHLISAGFHNFYISTHYKAEMLRDYFGDGEKWNVSIKYTYEKFPLGTAGALGLLPKNLSKNPILMMNGDLLTKIDLRELLSFHKEEKALATICVRKYGLQVPYGVIESKASRVTKIIEKPIHNFFINAGIYILNPSLLEFIGKDQYIDMPDLLEQQISNGKQVNLFPIHEEWMDIGHIETFKKARDDAQNKKE